MSDRTGLEDILSISSGSDSKDSDTEFEDGDDGMDLNDVGAPIEWKKDFVPDDPTFRPGSATLASHLGITDTSSPYDILKNFITDEMIEDVCKETNKYVGQIQLAKPNAFRKWKDVTLSEMWRFIAINLAMGIVKKPSIKLYWSTNATISTPFFGDQMSRNRFESILSALHLHDKENVPPNCVDRFIKLGTFLPRLFSNMKAAVTPGEFLCLDESMLGYKGRLSFKQYNPMKRSRFGLLFYTLIDCETGMILAVLPYQGKSTNLPKPLTDELKRGGATVVIMMEPYFNNNHKVVTDNFFNSPTLAKKLLENGTHLLGTVQKRRKGMPKMTGKLSRGEVKTYSDGKILLERWNDRREVVMMNTFTRHEMIFSAARNEHNSRNKPNSVLLYNKTMGAVDSMDKTIKPYATLRKTYKWYKKVFFHFVDIAIYNAFQAYKYHHRGGRIVYSSYLDFLHNIVEVILQENPIERVGRGRPSTVPKAETVELHIPVRVGKSDCKVCKKVGKRSQTQTKCSVCNVRLCLQKGENSCFKIYHDNLRKPKQNRCTVTPRQVLGDIGNSMELSAPFAPTLASTPRAMNEFEMDGERSCSMSESLMVDLY